MSLRLPAGGCKFERQNISHQRVRFTGSVAAVGGIHLVVRRVAVTRPPTPIALLRQTQIVALRKHLPMIITTLRRTLLRSTASVPFARSRPCFSCAKRQFATSPPGAPNPATSPTASMLGTLTGELDKLAPRFEVHASQIRILQAPGEFYETLKVIG